MSSHIESGIYDIHQVDGKWIAERKEMVVETDSGGTIHMLVTGGSGEALGNNEFAFHEYSRWLRCEVDGVKLFILREEPTETCPDGRLRIHMTKQEMRPE